MILHQKIDSQNNLIKTQMHNSLEECVSSSDNKQSSSIQNGSSHYGSVGIKEPSKHIQNIHLSSFIVIAFVVLVGDTTRGILFPTLWPLVESLGGSKITQGFVVGIFSFGRVVSAPYLGFLSETRGYRSVLVISQFMIIIGAILYSYANSLTLLIITQLVLGLASGTLGVTRAYVAETTTNKTRTTYLGYLTALQFAGFTVTPFFGSLFSETIKDKEIIIFKIFYISKYTLPAFFMMFIATIATLLLLFQFEDRKHIPKETEKKNEMNDIENAHNNISSIEKSKIRYITIAGLLMNVATKGTIACFETLGVQIATNNYNLQQYQVGYIFSICGLIGVISLMSMGFLHRFLNDVKLILLGMSLMIISCLLSIQVYPSIIQFIVAIALMYSIGYPIGHTAVLTAFSKALGNAPQGLLLGWFASAGSIARIIYPIFSGYISQLYGNNVLFAIISGNLIIAFIFVSFAYRTVVNLITSD